MPDPISPQPMTPTVLIAICPLPLSLDDHRDALSAADAGGGQAVGGLAPAQLVDEGEQQARAGRRQGMAERDRAAVHVGARTVEAQLLLHRQVLAGEGLV